jgi:hypothetical protein
MTLSSEDNLPGLAMVMLSSDGNAKHRQVNSNSNDRVQQLAVAINAKS